MIDAEGLYRAENREHSANVWQHVSVTQEVYVTKRVTACRALETEIWRLFALSHWFLPQKPLDIMRINYGHVRHEREGVSGRVSNTLYINFMCNYVVEKIADAISNFIELN